MPAIDLASKLSLADLLDGIAEAPPVEVTGIASDSRALEPGNVFFACRGGRHHGLEFVADAIAADVAAIVWDGDTPDREPPPAGVPAIRVEGLHRRLGEIADRWFGRPSEKLRVAGVTGTNGKTTVAFLVADCMRRLDRRCGYVGTLGAGLDQPFEEAGLTTPACVDLHGSLADFHAAGATHAALEVSSHALDQNRIDGVRFDSALFTNLSRDHIDYHGDMREYGEVKARLFEREVAHRIVNVDSDFGRELAGRAAGNDLVAVSTDRRNAFAKADAQRVLIRASDPTGHGFRVDVDSSWGAGRCRLPLVGQFNVANAALALAQLLCWGIAFDDAIAALEACEPPPGRLQRVAAGAGAAPAVYVDYAHTPAALEAVLSALRPHCMGNLWCVFGCGGDRDRGKRSLMGATAMRLADRTVVTTDNPRSEDPAGIIADVLEGMDARAIAIPDRARAIRWAIDEARDHDVVLIAGKGHETVQIVGNERLPFSDRDVARNGLLARLARNVP